VKPERFALGSPSMGLRGGIPRIVRRSRSTHRCSTRALATVNPDGFPPGGASRGPRRQSARSANKGDVLPVVEDERPADVAADGCATTMTLMGRQRAGQNPGAARFKHTRIRNLDLSITGKGTVTRDIPGSIATARARATGIAVNNGRLDPDAAAGYRFIKWSGALARRSGRPAHPDGAKTSGDVSLPTPIHFKSASPGRNDFELLPRASGARKEHAPTRSPHTRRAPEGEAWTGGD